MIGYVVEGRKRPFPISKNCVRDVGETAVSQYHFAKAGRGGDKGEFAALLQPWLSCLMRGGRGMGNGRN
ncbi:MAG: hypothetical protein GY765_10685 [bacterium]|nr:hypothetical protein [bacterium]